MNEEDYPKKREQHCKWSKKKGLTVLGDIELSQCGRLDAQGTTGLTQHMQWAVLPC